MMIIFTVPEENEKKVLTMAEYILTQYERGEWELFSLISSAWHGKQYYFLNDNGTVYSRASHKNMSREEAIYEFLEQIGEQIWLSISSGKMLLRGVFRMHT